MPETRLQNMACIMQLIGNDVRLVIWTANRKSEHAGISSNIRSSDRILPE